MSSGNLAACAGSPAQAALPVTRLWFEAPFSVSLREEQLAAPAAGEATVRTLVSAISPGTEMLAWRGQLPTDQSLDARIGALHQPAHYPFRYGYACVGEVSAIGDHAGEDAGDEVGAALLGRRVFAFEPHAGAFTAPASALLPVPDALPSEHAALLPMAETAVSLVLDSAPLLGERVAVFGAGVVGLLALHLLARFPLAALTAIDPVAERRARALQAGATHALHPEDCADLRDCDLVLELSGNPRALEQALNCAGFDSRVLVGSWYGTQVAQLNLGGHFHRSRMRIISSQVSTLSPALSGRWNRARRFDEAWRLLASPFLPTLITHRFPFASAGDAYKTIDQHADAALAVLLTYA